MNMNRLLLMKLTEDLTCQTFCAFALFCIFFGHSQYGFVTKKDMLKPAGTELKTNKDHSLFLLDADFRDMYGKIKRGAQIIPVKDVGYILVEAGITKDSIVVDAGAGSGGLSGTGGTRRSSSTSTSIRSVSSSIRRLVGPRSTCPAAGAGNVGQTCCSRPIWSFWYRSRSSCRCR